MSIPLMTAADESSFWFGPKASTYAGEVDWLFDFIMWISAVFFVLIIGIGAYFAVKYRRREGQDVEPSPTHNTSLELVWSVIPTILVAVIFWYGFEIYMDIRSVPRNTYDVNVTAFQWGWEFQYPNGHVTNELRVPQNERVRLVMTSKDVIHSLWIPDFRTKADCVPGRFSYIWFQAPKEGEHWLWCTEYCGTGHSEMGALVTVMERSKFDAWLKKDSDIHGNNSPVDAGKLLYQRRGCAGCHSVDGSAMTGPTFVWAKSGAKWQEPREVTSGRNPIFDENYIQQSIWEPDAEYVKGYAPAMASYAGQLTQQDINAIIAYLKDLNGVGQ